MGFGSLTPAMLQELRRCIPEGHVLDAGCGDGMLSEKLAQWLTVTGVDPEAPETSQHPNITYKRVPLEHVLPPSKPISAVFCSWPEHHHGTVYDTFTTRLLCLAHTSGKLALLTRNTDGTVCGSLLLWTVVSRWKVLTSVPDPHNVLTVYDTRSLREKPEVLPEEYAALTVSAVVPNIGPIFYEDIYGK